MNYTSDKQISFITSIKNVHSEPDSVRRGLSYLRGFCERSVNCVGYKKYTVSISIIIIKGTTLLTSR